MRNPRKERRKAEVAEGGARGGGVAALGGLGLAERGEREHGWREREEWREEEEGRSEGLNAFLLLQVKFLMS